MASNIPSDARASVTGSDPAELRPVSKPDTSFGVSPKFPTTLWTDVRRAGQGGGTQAAESLEKLCRIYWYPLYAFVRRLGHSHHDAQELTQGFFEHLLGRQLLASADQLRGKFRSYLLLTCKSYLRDEWQKRVAVKRGGGAVVFSLDAQDAEDADTRYRLEPADKLDPEKIYERRWALTLLSRALDRLEAEFKTAATIGQFEAMKPFLKPERGETNYANLAGQLGVTENAAHVAVHRFRRRYRKLLREEVAQTVELDELEDEMQHIRRVLSC